MKKLFLFILIYFLLHSFVSAQKNSAGQSGRKTDAVSFPMEPVTFIKEVRGKKDTFEIYWHGEQNLRAQWFKILAESTYPTGQWDYANHSKGEPPTNTYYIWHFDKEVPDGTKLLLEGDFPHCRMFTLQIGAPGDEELPIVGDGSGYPEIVLMDEDIDPDPGHTNPFRPGANRDATDRHYHVTFELKNGKPWNLSPDVIKKPYRGEGNHRYGGTKKVFPFPDNQKLRGGPYVWVRIYMPDQYDPYGGVEPPVLRIQFPGEEPILAPICRQMETREGGILNYEIDENPAYASGVSEYEIRAHEILYDQAQAGLDLAGTPGTYFPSVHNIFSNPDSTLKVFRRFTSSFFIAFLKKFGNKEYCVDTLPDRHFYLYRISPTFPYPLNPEHTSGHCPANTYLDAVANIKPGQLLMISGKKPVTPVTTNGNNTMPENYDLRGFIFTASAGNNDVGLRLTPVITITDEEVITMPDGSYIMFIGRPADKPDNLDPERFTWRDWTIGNLLNLNFRVFSSNLDWAHDPKLLDYDDAPYCIEGENPNALKEHMGEYNFYMQYISSKDAERLIKQVITNVDEKVEVNGWMIYPNPSEKQVKLVFDNPSNIQTIEIWNHSSKIRTIQRSLAAKSLVLNTDNFTPGIYFVRVYDHKKVSTKKLIIK